MRASIILLVATIVTIRLWAIRRTGMVDEGCVSPGAVAGSAEAVRRDWLAAPGRSRKCLKERPA